MELAIRDYRKAVSQADWDGMHDFARCLEYGTGIGRALFLLRNTIVDLLT
jgi:hypothetical protein